jgi:hypothetical protein
LTYAVTPPAVKNGHVFGEAQLSRGFGEVAAKQHNRQQYFSKMLQLMLPVIGTIVGQVGQVVALPLFISSFSSSSGGLVTGPYFVFFFCCILFNIFFWPLAYAQRKTIDTPTQSYCSKHHLMLVAIGVCDAANGLLTVYSSSASRVPAQLQPFLLQVTVPLYLVTSKLLLGVSYNYKQLLGCGLVVMSIVISLVSSFDSVHAPSSFWATVLILGVVPGVCMNVLEERVFEACPSFSIPYLLAWESLYQLITCVALFWTDIVPGFGTSADIVQFWDNFQFGFRCFFVPTSSSLSDTSCSYCAPFGLLFAGCYTLSYLASSYLMRSASANTNGLVVAVCSPVAVVFWFLAPGVAASAGNPPISHPEIMYALLSLPTLVIGIFLYRSNEDDSTKARHNQKALSGKLTENLLHPDSSVGCV